MTQLPASLVAGDTWTWTRDYADYPATTWDATAYFEYAGVGFNVAGIADDDLHGFTISAATTAEKEAGRYKWWVRVTDGTTVVTVEEGWLEVKPDPSATGTREHRSQARQMLDAIEATLLGRATDGQLAMAINGRSISRISLDELQKFRAQLRQEVRVEDGLGSGRDIKVRYGRV